MVGIQNKVLYFGMIRYSVRFCVFFSCLVQSAPQGLTRFCSILRQKQIAATVGCTCCVKGIIDWSGSKVQSSACMLHVCTGFIVLKSSRAEYLSCICEKF